MECSRKLSQIHVVGYVLQSLYQEDMEFFKQFYRKGIIDKIKTRFEISHPFAHLTYTNAIEILQKSGKTFEFEVKWGTDLQSEHERYLAEEYCKKTCDSHRLSRKNQSLLYAR